MRKSNTTDFRIYPPQFSPSAFFHAIDEFHSGMEDTNKSTNIDSCRVGEVLTYGEVISSTQTTFDRNPYLLRALHLPSSGFVSLVTAQLAGRGKGGNAWLSLAGCLQMSLKIHVGLKGSSSIPGPATLPSNPAFIQYLYALVIMDACHVLNPASERVHKVRLK
ncbi:hypothetical protein BDR07DRAFT_254553 [Suillus spraguei]|nr:hypothetical protein BDR07DRAFT_254553 [Suillus spraguei]